VSPWPFRALSCALAFVVAASLPAEAQGRRGRLIVTVADQTGAVIQHATVTVTHQDTAAQGVVIAPTHTGNEGVAVVDGLPDGRYTLQVEFPGFATSVLQDIRVRGGDTRRRVTLQISKLDEAVTVSRDRQSAALDPQGSAFSSVLTREQIDSLPDDPDEMEAVLKAMAPPGSTIRVDGFTGGKLPPKSQIRSIRLPRMDMFAAQNHGGMMGMMHIDIMTMPGHGPLRGNTDIHFMDESFNARNAFTSTKPQEQLRQYGWGLSGTIKPNRTSFSINGGGGSQYASPNLLAVLPDGSTTTETIRQPRDSYNVNARLDHAINKDHAIRASFDRNASTSRSLGVGGYNLFDRAFDTESSMNTFRFSENGPVGRRGFTESRLQLRWTGNENTSAVESPTIRVQDAFTSGGAQQRGGRHAFDVELASDFDYVKGAHSWRTGVLLEGGRYRSDDTSNYLGTYTFASMADYQAGRAANYSRRTGDPNIEYSSFQVGTYVQDDWRLTRSLLVSGGIRFGLQNHVGDQANISPRASAAWSPFRNGSTTLRASYGYFYDWVSTDLYKQTLLIDGFRQREVNVFQPSYPDPGDVGDAPPTNRYLWSDDLDLPMAHRITTGLERSLTKNSRLNLSYSRGWGRGLLRGRNDNAPVNGQRPDPRFANTVAMVSDAESRTESVGVFFSFVRMDWRRTFLTANYNWSRNDTNTTGAFSIPASGDDLGTEWGPAGTDVRHRFGGSFSSSPFRNVSVGLNLRAQSGMPFNITTGRDNNTDGLFNDRPAGTARNSARGDWQIDLGGRVSYAIGFGQPRQQGGPGGAQIVIGGGGGGMAPGFGGGAADKRYRVEFYVSGQNLLNRVNYTAYSFVMTSPFFGQPIAASQPRRIQIGARFGF
jgi:hypothetical protein